MKLVAVTTSEFGALNWLAPKGYARAAGDAVATLVVQEMPSAVLAMPVAFIQQEDEFILVAVQGLQPGQNLYIAEDGRWRAGYIPAAYRAYPFAVAKTENSEQVLCFDQESNLLSKTDGEPFYGSDGALSDSVKKIADFLGQVVQNKILTTNVCSLLQKYNLIQPWQITLKQESGEKKLNGLFRIDEQALRKLTAESLKELSDAGALSIAYLQLVSMNHFPRLVEMARAQALAAQEKKSVDLDFLKKDTGTIDLSFL